MHLRALELDLSRCSAVSENVSPRVLECECDPGREWVSQSVSECGTDCVRVCESECEWMSESFGSTSPRMLGVSADLGVS